MFVNFVFFHIVNRKYSDATHEGSDGHKTAVAGAEKEPDAWHIWCDDN